MTENLTEHHWERVADEWIAWTRAPGHDAFWAYVEAFRNFVPEPRGHTLDIGCGEGRISRELTALGHKVTATDIAPSLLSAAEEAESAESYHRADAVALPFADSAFDRVIAYNMLMDVPDMPAVTAEAARVLAPDGVLTISVLHPLVDRGASVLESENESYFDSIEIEDSENRDGLTMHFHGWSHPLGAYTAALTNAGLVITELIEPRPSESAVRNRPALAKANRFPFFLWINAQRGTP